GHGEARVSGVLRRRARPRRPYHRSHVPGLSRAGQAGGCDRYPPQPPHLDPHLEGMGIAIVALGTNGPALRFPRADVGRRSGTMVHGKEAVETRYWPRLL